ncbi:hypothetical protein [Methyloversatilis universalis]|uniref:hypothetical protein n=1 Tax=Methyloversatilis universalis TaxID=378211 RepID=UPI0012FB820F|nr:hypothetical protein [Methyloversatilis universalis]
MIANYIDQIIMFFVGTWASGVAYKFIPAPGKDPIAKLQWRERYSKLLKTAGPLLVFTSLALAIAKYFGIQ